MTEPEVEQVLAILYAAFPREKSSPLTVAVYMAGLSDLDADCARRAAEDWIRESRYWPTVSDVRKRAKDLQDGMRGRVSAQQSTAALPPGKANEAKNRALIANIQAWSMGLIDDETMMRDGSRIYAEMQPIPSDAEEVVAATEADIAAMKARRGANGGKPTGNLGSALRGAVGQVAGRAARFPAPPGDAGPAGDRKDPPRHRQRSSQGAWWDGN